MVADAEDVFDKPEFVSVKGKVALVLTDPPYGMSFAWPRFGADSYWWITFVCAGILGVEHDKKLTEDKIEHVLKGIAALLQKGGTAIIFLDQGGIVAWERVASKIDSLYSDYWLHVCIFALRLVCTIM